MMSERILLIRTGALGDTITTTGIVRRLKELNPDSEISVATEFPQAYRNNSRVVRVDRKGNFNVQEFDRVIDLDLSYEMRPNIHFMEAYASKAGLNPNDDLRPELFVYGLERVYVDTFDLPKKFIAIHMRRHYWPHRNLPGEFYIDLISRIIGLTDYSVVQTGNQHDLRYDIPELEGRLINLVDRLDVQQTAAMLERAHAFIGVDSGVMHIAEATDVPILSMYSSHRAETRYPRYHRAAHVEIAANIDCYGCVEKIPVPMTQYQCLRGDEACTRTFDPAVVFEKLTTIL